MMTLRTILFSFVILSALFLSAFAAPASSPAIRYQETVVPPDVTLVPPTVEVLGTPGVPVTGEAAPTGMWTIVLFGLLAMLGIAFLVALFSPRATHDHVDRTPPHDHM